MFLKARRLAFQRKIVLWHVCDLLFSKQIKQLNEHPPSGDSIIFAKDCGPF